ncbi:glycosyltransferase [Limosilactobacillus oris]|uniref:glycosyltransferase n=1 Tax=Limosilactobacillus oris TaxID=1632 RepID=UPI00188484C0|nr:glycosyltransferase [Limosilactobacillus oris]MBF0601457.1 glycosyltransferase [Limosilactobacillus oris]
MERISLIILTNGTENGLKRCVETCLEQDYPDLEVIVASNDPEIATKLPMTDCKIVVKSGEKRKNLKAVGLAQAIGDYVLFIEAEDFLAAPDAVTKLMNIRQKGNNDVLFTNFVALKDGEFIYPSPKIAGILMPLNFMLFIRYYASFRRLGGNLFSRHLLLELGDNLNDFSIQDLSYHLLELAQSPNFTEQICYVWDGTKSIPPFVWPDDYHFTDTARLAFSRSTTKWTKTEQIKIAVCVDNYGASKVKVLLYSLDRNHPCGGTIYLIYDHLDNDLKASLVQLGNQFMNFKLELIKFSVNQRRLLQQISLEKSHLPLSAYYRILIPYLLPEVERVIYVDYDTLVIGNLTDLYNTNLHGNFLGVVRDLGVVIKNDWSKALLGMLYQNYFNSGVLLMDLTAFRKYGLSWLLHQFIVASTPFFVLEDQDALNLFFKDAVEYVGIENNYVTKLFANGEVEEKRQLEKIKILHYLGPEKPWQNISNYPTAMRPAINLYRKYRQELYSKNSVGVPMISVVMIVKQQHEIRRCLESICCQDWPRIEVIVVDASSDSIAVKRVIEEYQEQITQIKYQRVNTMCNDHQLHQLGLKTAVGEYLTFINAIDYMADKMPIVKVMGLLRTKKIDFLCTMHMFTLDGKIMGYNAPGSLIETTGNSTTSLLAYQQVEYQQLTGIFFASSLLSMVNNESSDKVWLQQLFSASRHSAFWQGYSWIESER